MALRDQAPHLTAAVINTILAKTVGDATPAELNTIRDALNHNTVHLMTLTRLERSPSGR
jgi:hypothetical protein